MQNIIRLAVAPKVKEVNFKILNLSNEDFVRLKFEIDRFDLWFCKKEIEPVEHLLLKDKTISGVLIDSKILDLALNILLLLGFYYQ